jgi:hypothetical protein
MMISYDRNMYEFLNVFSVLIIDTEIVLYCGKCICWNK